MHHRSLIVVATVAVLGAASCGADGPSATATFASPTDGASVSGGLAFSMTAEGVTIEPAGEVREGFGHFHVIADAGCVATGTGIGKDADHLHFGNGQTEGVIYLEPGEHELCLQVGDGVHAAQDITDTVKVDVSVATLEQWCAVIGEIDAMFERVDISDGDLASRQVDLENIRRLTVQATDGLGTVDAAVRDDVGVTLGFAGDLAAVMATAASPDDAEAALAPIYEAASDGLPGTAWILDACGVDIEGE